MDPEISKLSHEAVFQTYKQLKTVLPKDLIKLKVLKSQRYPIIKPSIINQEKEKRNNDKEISLTEDTSLQQEKSRWFQWKR